MAELSGQSYCLVQSNLDPIEPGVLKAAFRAVGELVDADAQILSADAFGILADGLRAQTARTVASALAKAGVSVAIVHEQKIPRRPPSRPLRRCACLPEVFVATDTLGRDEPLDWSKVLVLAAGMVPLREAKRVVRRRYKSPLGSFLGGRIRMGSGIVGAFGAAVAPDREASIRYKRQSRGLLDIFVDCEPYCYRIRADKFNFSYLGDRQSGKRLEDFAQLVGDCIRYAGGAALNRGAVAIREEGLEATFGYPSRHAFEEETIWVLYKFGLRRGRGWPWMAEQ